MYSIRARREEATQIGGGSVELSNVPQRDDNFIGGAGSHLFLQIPDED